MDRSRGYSFCRSYRNLDAEFSLSCCRNYFRFYEWYEDDCTDPTKESKLNMAWNKAVLNREFPEFDWQKQ